MPYPVCLCTHWTIHGVEKGKCLSKFALKNESSFLKGGRASGPQKYNAVPRPLTAHIFNNCLVFSPVLLGEILMDAAVIHVSCGNPCDPPPRLPSENWTVESAGKHGAHSWLPFFLLFFREKHAHIATVYWHWKCGMRQETARYEKNKLRP